MKKLRIMKKLLLLLMIVPMIGFGQEIKYTIYSGVNYTKPIGEGIEYVKEYYEWLEELTSAMGRQNTGGVNGIIGLNIGLNIDYNIIKNLSLSSGLSYSEKGFKTNLEGFDMDFLTDNTGQVVGEFVIKNTSNTNVNMNYINVPILIKHNTTNGFYIGAGMNISFLINETVKGNAEYEVIDDPLNSGNINELTSDMLPDNIEIDSDWDSQLGYSDPEGMIIGTQLVLGYNINRYDLSFRVNRSGNFAKSDRSFDLLQQLEEVNNEIWGFNLNDYDPEKLKYLTLQLSIGYTF